MVDARTVFIVGAGASMPYGFPSGDGLIRRILEHLEPMTWAQIEIATDSSPAETAQFRGALLKSGTTSIDAFLEGRPELVAIGKAAIAAALIPLETAEGLYRQRDGAWYSYLLSRLGGTPETFAQSRLTILTFNYDRSLDYFLLTAIQHRFGLSPEQAVDLLNQAVNIHHMHGLLGTLPPFAGPPESARLYDPELSPEAIRKAAGSINVIHDQRLDTYPQFDAARAALLSAAEGQVYFLGFGFHHVNLRRLGIPEIFNHNHHINGTCFGMEAAEISMAQRSAGRCVLRLGPCDVLTMLRQRWETRP